MSVSSEITIGGRPVSGVYQGAEYRVTRLAGWWERPAVKREDVKRELADGDFPAIVKYEARYIGIDGTVICQNHDQMHQIMDELNGLCAWRREDLVIGGHGVTTQALVEPDGQPFLLPETDRILRFELRFKANDPRRYGMTEHVVTAGGSWTQVAQVGNYPTFPVVRVRAQGTSEGFEMLARAPHHTALWRYLLPPSEGNDVVFDVRASRPIVNGVMRPDATSTSAVWSIRPGELREVQVTPIGPGSVEVDVHYRDAWI